MIGVSWSPVHIQEVFKHLRSREESGEVPPAECVTAAVRHGNLQVSLE